MDGGFAEERGFSWPSPQRTPGERRLRSQTRHRCTCCRRGPPYPKPAADPGAKAREGDRVTAGAGAADALWEHLCSWICQRVLASLSGPSAPAPGTRTWLGGGAGSPAWSVPLPGPQVLRTVPMQRAAFSAHHRFLLALEVSALFPSLTGTEGCPAPRLCPGWGWLQEPLRSDEGVRGTPGRPTAGPHAQASSDREAPLTRLVLDVGLGPALGGDLRDVHLLVLDLNLRRNQDVIASEKVRCQGQTHVPLESLFSTFEFFLSLCKPFSLLKVRVAA